MIWEHDTHERHVVPLKSFRNLSNRRASIYVLMLCNCITMILHKTNTVYNAKSYLANSKKKLSMLLCAQWSSVYWIVLITAYLQQLPAGVDPPSTASCAAARLFATRRPRGHQNDLQQPESPRCSRKLC